MSHPNLDDVAARLRQAALRHPTVLSIKRDLSALPDEEAPAPGLYAETGAVPGIVVNGELRVSIVRLFSVDETGTRKLVGQVQATRLMDHPLAMWELRFYVHVHKFYATHRIEDEAQWFVQVLEQHYEQGGEAVEMTSEVPA